MKTTLSRCTEWQECERYRNTGEMEWWDNR